MSEKLTTREAEIIAELIKSCSAENDWCITREFDDQAQYLSKVNGEWFLMQWDDETMHMHTVCGPNHEQRFSDLREALAAADRWRDEEREPCDCEGPIWR